MAHVRRDERGAAAVEAALVLCFLVVPLIFTVIGYAYMFSFRQTLSQAASEGARAAVGAPTCTTAMSSPYTGSTCDAQKAAASAVSGALSSYSMSCGASNLTCDITAPFSGTSGGTTCPTGHTCVKVQVSYPYRDHPLIPSFPLLGIVLPSSLSFTSVVEVS